MHRDHPGRVNGRPCSRRPGMVLVDEPTEDRAPLDLLGRRSPWAFDRTLDIMRTAKIERAMRPMRVVMRDILTQDIRQVSSAHDQHVIEHLRRGARRAWWEILRVRWEGFFVVSQRLPLGAFCLLRGAIRPIRAADVFHRASRSRVQRVSSRRSAHLLKGGSARSPSRLCRFPWLALGTACPLRPRSGERPPRHRFGPSLG